MAYELHAHEERFRQDSWCRPYRVYYTPFDVQIVTMAALTKQWCLLSRGLLGSTYHLVISGPR